MPNAMGQGSAGTSSAGPNFISTLVSRMPYAYRAVQNALESNPKYDTFNELITKPDKRIAAQSVFQQQPDGAAGQLMIDKRYHEVMYADIDADKVRRVQEYRKMAAYAELAECIDEIADEAIVKEKDGTVAKCFLRGDHDKAVQDIIQSEWEKFIDIFDLEDHGWELVRRFLVEGEIYFENVISENRPDYGILGVVSVPNELINPIYDNVQNQIVNGFLLRKPIVSPKATMTNQSQEELVVFDKNQITYMHSGMWNEDHTIRLPYIENARRAYKQLTLVEDSIIIYRLVRAPERLVFKVDVGNMPVPKAEEYVRKLMQQYWSKKNFDSAQGRVTNIYDPQSMLDAYWFTKRGQSEGTTVDQLQGGANLGQLDDLMYFIKKLYRALKVPQQRLDPEDPFQDGEQITREELRFAKFIIRIQQQIARGIRESFITHLKLREQVKDDPNSESLWTKFNLREHHMNVEFNMPSSFAVIQQIVANGPDFRKNLAMEAELMQGADSIAGVATGAGSALPADPNAFQPDIPPDFGPGPQGGEAAPAPAAVPQASSLPQG